MTRDEARGQYALNELHKYVEPKCFFIGSGKESERLYSLEQKRSEIVAACAKAWAVLAGVDDDAYWTQSLPQALHDLLENYGTATGIIAAEAYLKRHGWQVTRPQIDPGLAL